MVSVFLQDITRPVGVSGVGELAPSPIGPILLTRITWGETGVGATEQVAGTYVGTGENDLPIEGGAVHDLGDTVWACVTRGVILIVLVGLGRTRGGIDVFGQE